MTGASSPDVLVVGGGAIGACVAYELARGGATVTLLERGPELAAGCSAGNAGLICPSHGAPIATPAALRQGIRWMVRPDSPFRLRPRPALVPWLARFVASCTTQQAHAGTDVIRSLSVASLALHAQLAEAGLDTGFVRRGTLNVYETEAGLVAGRAESDRNRLAGLRAEQLELAAARELEPALAPTVAGAIYYPDEAHCDPRRFVHAVGQAAREAGARIETGVEVLGVVRSAGRVDHVQTSSGPVRAQTVVVAAGAWTPSLLAGLGVFVPVEAGKGYHVEVGDDAAGPRVPLFFQEPRVIATPLDGRLRLAGTLELGGLDTRVDQVRVRALLRAGQRNITGFGTPEVRAVWHGFRPCAPDGLPIVGRPAGLENLVLATGHAMMGLTLAPITGKLVAELVTGAGPSEDAAPLSPDRFRSLLSRVRRG